jgi:hypothetical protein
MSFYELLVALGNENFGNEARTARNIGNEFPSTRLMPSEFIYPLSTISLGMTSDSMRTEVGAKRHVVERAKCGKADIGVV